MLPCLPADERDAARCGDGGRAVLGYDTRVVRRVPAMGRMLGVRGEQSAVNVVDGSRAGPGGLCSVVLTVERMDRRDRGVNE